MTQQHRIKRLVFSDDEVHLGAHAQDMQRILKSIPVVEQLIAEQLYAEPMTIGGLREEPFCIECVRVINLFKPQTPQKCGGMVHFTWLPKKNGAVIANIDGMSPTTDGTTKFRFFFRVTYKLE